MMDIWIAYVITVLVMMSTPGFHAHVPNTGLNGYTALAGSVSLPPQGSSA